MTRKLLRYLVLPITLLSLGSVAYGFIRMDEDPMLANKCIGFGVVGLFLLAMPLFLATASRGKKIEDYMLTDDNIRKMRQNQRETPEKLE